MGDTLTTETFDHRAATDAHLVELHGLHDAIRREQTPEDPPIDHDVFVRMARALPDHSDVRHAIVREGSDPVAHLRVGVDNDGGNEHIAHVGLWVDPAHRRRGIARRLLGDAVSMVSDLGRTTLFFQTSDRVPAGGIAAEHHGLRLGYRCHTNRLVLADVDRAQVDEWRDQAAQRAQDYRLEWLPTPTRDEHVDLILTAFETMNDAPFEDLDMEDEKVSRELLESWERSDERRGMVRWRLFALTDAGEFAGFTDVAFSPGHPTAIWQGGTAVARDHRGHRLGLLLKTTMLTRILDEAPERLDIRTENADSNAWMLDINTRLGFRPWISEQVWQISLDDARALVDA